MKPGLAIVLFGTLSVCCACGGSSSPSAKAAPSAAETPIKTPPVVNAAPAAPAPAATAEPAAAAPPSVKSYPLPGATGPVTTDYLVFEPSHSRVWVPVGDTGSADVFDIAANSFTGVTGFKNAEREVHGKKRMQGPSAATVGDGVVYIGNRATAEVCAVDASTLALGRCLQLPTPTDGVSYVAAQKEVWVTTPRDNSLTILDAAKPSALAAKRVIKTEGEVEGYAIDAGRGLFYTNLEDKNRTLVVDIAKHAVKANWDAGCGEAGPRGVSLDVARNFVFVACTDQVRILDANHAGALLAKLDTGAGVDNIDYQPSNQRLYVAAARAAKLTIASIDDKGQPRIVATVPTAEGARNAVVDARGNAYLVDPRGARLLVVPSPP